MKDVEEILAEKAINSDDSQQKSPGIVPLTAAKITMELCLETNFQ